MANDPIGREIHDEWQHWAASCRCDKPERPAEAYGPHQAIRQGRLYCRLVAEEWTRIADWHRQRDQTDEVEPGDMYAHYWKRTDQDGD